MWRSRAIRTAAVLAVPLAILLALLAVEVLRTPGQLETDDVRFEAAPMRQQGLWADLGFLPGGAGKQLLDLEDDLTYRRTVAMFLRVEPGKVEIFGPELENLRGKVQFEITRGSAQDSNPERRAQLLNFLAAMSLERYGSDQTEADTILRRAIHTLRSAVETDPENADAKLNLELALRNAKAVNLPGTDPSGDAASGTISGQGHAGGGY
ncbi:MAG: hypothetical protein H0U82_00455 [Actinobacteria bacterium]|nr:hypothetical protein [Actinomycetota bacterium]